MLPLHCYMPDLADRRTFRLQSFSLLQGMIGDPGITRKQGSYRRNFCRLVDKAIYEYQVAREAILDEIYACTQRRDWPDGRPLFIFGFIDHFETCINAANRALRIFDRLKGDALLAELARDQRRSLEAHSRSLVTLRNAIEHVDNVICNDEMPEGRPVMLGFNDSGDRAVIGTYEVGFSDVALTLRKLYEIGEMLLNNELVRSASVNRK